MNGYPIDLLYENLAKIGARSVTVYLDAYFSGETPGGMLIGAISGISVVPRLPEKSPNLTVLTAAISAQVASWDDEAKHGLFTRYLLEGLYGAADQDRYGDGDGRITLAEVRGYLDREMTYAARRRYGRVQQASVHGDDGLVLAALDAGTAAGDASLAESGDEAPAGLFVHRRYLEAAEAAQQGAEADLAVERDRAEALGVKLAKAEEAAQRALAEVETRGERLVELTSIHNLALDTLTEKQRELAERQRQVELLNQKLLELRRQLASQQEALEAAEAENERRKEQVVDLGRRLNAALATKVQELARLRAQQASITSMDQTMVVGDVSALNVRDAPGGEKVDSLRGGATVEVTGRIEHEQATWYRVALAGGGTGWVFGEYLEEQMQRPPPATSPRTIPVVGIYPKNTGSRPGTTFKDCDDCPEMVVVPTGSFMMGSSASEPGRSKIESPRHRVTIPAPFAVGRFEVTFAEWDACMADGGCAGYQPSDNGWGRGRRPVINVSWDDAKTYEAWLSRKTGETYRLLSEAEWEYVARAGTETPFHTGDRISTDHANFDGNYTYNGSSKGLYRKQTVPVGSFAANRFGLHDVHGNVWEWVEDCWNGSYESAPSDGSAWTTSDCTVRVLRGGSWVNDPWILRSANRNWDGTDYRYDDFGFRVARTLAR